jgi:hypothetical protein
MPGQYPKIFTHEETEELSRCKSVQEIKPQRPLGQLGSHESEATQQGVKDQIR